MALPKYKHLFHDLNLPEIDELTSFSLIPSHLERQVAANNGGLDLNLTQKILQLGDDELNHYRKLAPGFDKRKKKELIELGLIKEYSEIREPCSMLVKNFKDLMIKVGEIYQIAYAHYVLAMNEDSGFPYEWCEESGKNIIASSWILGFPNASYVIDLLDYHGYNVFPFVISHSFVKGTIIIDPTSNQLWDYVKENQRPRNMMFITKDDTWEYRTQYNYGNNLFPSHALHIGKFNEKETMGLPSWNQLYEHNITPIKEYLQLAFDNPITLDSCLA